MQHVRRVVTGHDSAGKAIVVSDGAAPLVHTNPLRPGYSSTDIWRTAGMPATIEAAPRESTGGPRRQLPDALGTLIRINTLEPEPESVRKLDPAAAKSVFAAGGNPGASTYAAGGRHPMMHRTETVDYAIVLEGEVTMILDDSEVLLGTGDVVVQCGTNHAWSNHSDRRCRIAFILIDGRFDADLRAKLEQET
jgi:mannose-6-phosphate isomerase-like protein (cupin superfamily)